MALTVHPHRLNHFGVPARAFVLVTNTAHADHITIVPDNSYESCEVVTYDQGDDVNAMVQRLPQDAHVLVISPKHGFAAPPPALLGTRQVSAVLCHSTATTRAQVTQPDLYKALEPLTRHAIIATVCAGAITQFRAAEPQAAPAVTLFQDLLMRYPHYRTIAEIGLSFNDAFEPLPGNHAANEVWGGRYGTVHIGIGPQPFTPYHVTVVCPGLTLMGKDSQVLVGQPPATEV